MIQEFQIRVLPEQAANEQSLKQFIGHDKGLDIRIDDEMSISVVRLDYQDVL